MEDSQNTPFGPAELREHPIISSRCCWAAGKPTGSISQQSRRLYICLTSFWGRRFSLRLQEPQAGAAQLRLPPS